MNGRQLQPMDGGTGYEPAEGNWVDQGDRWQASEDLGRTRYYEC
ncbi:hypothetical protein CASFOL_004926 [Castilleja foliolosa]|uniref:MHC class I antigen n=1 Tax=Castilleja foliolosa TaxID=1961234 RepID=A0ABD3EFJ2_9LAMI